MKYEAIEPFNLICNLYNVPVYPYFRAYSLRIVSVTVTVTEALVLRPLLEDRGCITESIHILVPVNRIKRTLSFVKMERTMGSVRVPAVGNFFTGLIHHVGCIIKSVLHSTTLKNCRSLLDTIKA